MKIPFFKPAPPAVPSVVDANPNGVQEYIPQWQEKIGWKLYPACEYVEAPELKDSKDVLVSTTTVHITGWDRLRLLISGRVEVVAKTTTQNEIGAHLTNSGVSVRPPSWLSRKEPK